MNADRDDLPQMIAYILEHKFVVQAPGGGSISFDKALGTYTVKNALGDEHEYCIPEDDEYEGFDESLAKEAVMHFLRLP